MSIIKKIIILMGCIAINYATNISCAAPAPQKPATIDASFNRAVRRASYAANAKSIDSSMRKKLQAERLCLTNFKDKEKEAKLEYRALVFEAATALNHPHPELIMLENNTQHDAFAGMLLINGQEGLGIVINQDNLDKIAYGARRMTIYHEVAHLAQKHCTLIQKYFERNDPKVRKLFDDLKKLQEKDSIKTYGQEYCTEESKRLKQTYLINMQNFQRRLLYNEYEADQLAAQATACAQCSQEEGDWYFGLSNDTKGEKLEKIQSMNYDQLKLRLEVVEPETRAYCSTGADYHPLHFERALRFHLYAKCAGIAGKLCAYHEQKALAVARKKKQQAKLRAQRAVTTAKTRRVAQCASAGKAAAGAGVQAAAQKNNVRLFTLKELSSKKYVLKKLSSVLGKPVNTTVDLLLGKQIIPDETDNWSFKADNTFTRGEIVSVKKDGRRYAVVLNQDDQGVIVQLELDTKSKKIPTNFVGKKIG